MKQLTKRNATIALTMLMMASVSTPSLAQKTRGFTKVFSAPELAAKAAAATVHGIEAKHRFQPAPPAPHVSAPNPKLNTPVPKLNTPFPALPRSNAKLVKVPEKEKKQGTKSSKKSK